MEVLSKITMIFSTKSNFYLFIASIDFMEVSASKTYILVKIVLISYLYI